MYCKLAKPGYQKFFFFFFFFFFSRVGRAARTPGEPTQTENRIWKVSCTLGQYRA